jgi:hypothetical protein
MFRRVGNMKPEEVFTRTVFGIVMIAAAFVDWGRWVTGILGVLFLISAFQGFCITCHLYRQFADKSKNS